jgi:hypothetical protein
VGVHFPGTATDWFHGRRQDFERWVVFSKIQDFHGRFLKNQGFSKIVSV